MLLWQGVRALELWLGQALEPDVIERMRRASR
jgi:shikimate 5-dehydrogenase